MREKEPGRKERLRKTSKATYMPRDRLKKGQTGTVLENYCVHSNPIMRKKRNKSALGGEYTKRTGGEKECRT